MPYVRRDGGGAVVAAFARPQPGTAEEFIPEVDAEIAAFRAAAADAAPLTAEELYDVLAAKGVLAPEDRPRPKRR